MRCGRIIIKMRNTNSVMNSQKITAGIVSFFILVAPVLAWAEVGIPCGDLAAGQKECGFNDLITLANSIIKFLMISVAVPLAAIGFMWVGGKMILSPNKESAKTEAKQSFANIAMGFGIMLGAYVLIKMVLFAFLDEKYVKGSILEFMFQ